MAYWKVGQLIGAMMHRIYFILHICMSVGHVHKVYSIISICKNDVYSTQLLIMDFVCYRRDCYSVCM